MKLPPRLRLRFGPALLTAIAGISAASAQQRDPATANTPTATKSEDEVITLSPFEVTTDAKGYYAPNSMSGTRFNSKIEDLGTAITVVTKEQMQDFAMTDINDVFLYTASTEGTGTYTDYTVDRNGQVSDNVQNNPNQANRIRGMLSANVSYGNYETQNRMPIDPLIIDGIEVNRGPNANVFGLGNSSGTVNQVPATANLSRNFTRVEGRVDSYGGWRTSIDLNRALLKDKLGIRAQALYQDEEFIRKPSGMKTVRYDGFVKYKPFKYTTISAGYLYYKSYGNRPNFTPPRDYVSYWLQSGKPGWDPVAQVVHVNGQTLGPFTSDASVPDYFTRVSTVSSRSNLFIDQNGLAYWTAPNATNPSSTPPTPAANNQSIRLMQSSAGPGSNGATLGRLSNQPLFTTTASVNNQSIYDWTEFNTAAVNRLMDKSQVYNVQLDQIFINTERHLLAFQAGFFREDSQRYRRTPMGDAGISGQTGQLFIDVNEKLLDGSPNPFFGRPYIGVAEPLTRWTPQRWDTYRAQLGYQLDLRNEKGWLKWLGLQQFTAYDEYKYRITRQYAYRDVLKGDFGWTAPTLAGFGANNGRAVQSNVTGGVQAGANITRGYFRYYVGDNNGGNFDYAPGDFNYGIYPFVWGGYTSVTGGIPNPSSGKFVTEQATLAQYATTDSTGGNNNLQQTIKTPGAVLQSHWLDDRLVTTFGLRKDKVYSKNGYAIPALVNGNSEHDFATDNHWAAGDYRYNQGKTQTSQFVVRPFRGIGIIDRAAESGSGVSKFFAEMARGMTLFYNKSDNFIPQPPAVDLYLNPLPNTTGHGKDWGFWLNFFDNKLVLRVDRYDNKQINARDGDANTVAQRVLRMDLDISSDAYQLYDNAARWVATLHPEYNADQIKTSAIVDYMKMTVDKYDALVTNFRAGTIAATNDINAKGTEVELFYNPTKYWTMSGSVTEGTSQNQNISSAVQNWIDERMPIWTKIVDPLTDTNNGGWVATADNPQHLWWLHNYGGSQTASQNFATFVQAPYSVIKQLEGKSRPSVRKYNFRYTTSVGLQQFTDHHILKNFKVGGAIRWEDKGAIGYYGKDYKALLAANQPITELDASNPIWDKAHTYFDAFVSYKTRLFANKVGTTFQLNVTNLTESGGTLRPIGAFPDGTPNAYRIIDPRIFRFTVTFDL